MPAHDQHGDQGEDAEQYPDCEPRKKTAPARLSRESGDDGECKPDEQHFETPR